MKMMQPLASDEGYIFASPYKNPPEPPKCDECKDEGPEDGEPCKKCGYQRF